MTKEKRMPPALPKDTRIHEKRKYPDVSISKVLKTISDKCGCASVETFGQQRGNKDTDVLIFLPRAYKEFKNMVYWGECHPINKDEQIYQGIGHILMDGKRRIIIVSHFMYVYAAERSPTSASIMSDKYDSIMSRIRYEREIYVRNERTCNRRKDGTVYDPFIDIAGSSERVLYGHTHPNLGCFFSAPDRISGFATEDFPAVTFVADPIRKDMKAGVGVELKDAQILAYSYDEIPKSLEKRLTKRRKEI